MSLVRKCDDKLRLSDLYTSVRGASLLKASQRVVFNFRVNYHSHYYQTPSMPAFKLPGAFAGAFVL